MPHVPLPEGPSTLRLQDLPKEWREEFGSLFSDRLAQTLVIELDVDDESNWGESEYPRLLELLKPERIRSLTFAKGRFAYSYKESDPLHDGIMGWVRASREECAGPALAASMEKCGLPATLLELVIRNAGLDASATKRLLPALPPGLEKLDLSDNDIGSDGLRALVTAGLSALAELSIGWKGFGDAHAAVLVDSKLPALSRLGVSGPLSRVSRRRLNERFGDTLRLAP